MKCIEQKITGLYLLVPDLHTDHRGVFRRSFCEETLAKHGIEFRVAQGNVSENTHKYTLRGFHYQKQPSNESKILSCITGALYNVVIDLRKDSPSYLKWVALEISSEDRKSIIVPAGCANAFLTMQDNTRVHYYMGDSFREESYSGFRYNDPRFNIAWPCEPAVISTRDLSLPLYSDE